jgi:hypothetical protein
MSPSYTARAAAAGETAPPVFALNGANGHIPAKVSSLNLLAVPIERQVAYTQYVANLDAFVAATSAGKKVFCGADAYPFTARARLQIPELMRLYLLSDILVFCT